MTCNFGTIFPGHINLSIKDAPISAPGAGEALLRRRGRYPAGSTPLPFTLDQQAIATVEALGISPPPPARLLLKPARRPGRALPRAGRLPASPKRGSLFSPSPGRNKPLGRRVADGATSPLDSAGDDGQSASTSP